MLTTIEVVMKRCTKCGLEKPRSDFSKQVVCKDGLRYQCRTCDAERQRTPVGKAIGRKHRQSDKGQASRKKYVQSDVYKVSNKKSNKKSYATIRGYLQKIFGGMIRRCTSPNVYNYHRYGGRGIKVCFASSEEFIEYVVNILQVDPRGFDIDRIDNDGNYEPGNIRFIPHKENCQNKGFQK